MQGDPKLLQLLFKAANKPAPAGCFEGLRPPFQGPARPPLSQVPANGGCAQRTPIRGVSGISRLYQEIFLGIYIPVVKSLLVAFLLRAGVGGTLQSWARGRRGRASGVTILVPTDRSGGPLHSAADNARQSAPGRAVFPDSHWGGCPGGGSEGAPSPPGLIPRSVPSVCLPGPSEISLPSSSSGRPQSGRASGWLMRPSSAVRHPAQVQDPSGTLSL